MIGIIDYGASNLLSVSKALIYLGADTKIITSENDLTSVDKIVFPGVGAFETAVNKLHETGLFNPLKSWINNNKPFLGICLGLQLLFDSSEESKSSKGFGFINGKVTRFNSLKVPQIGWNQIKIQENVDIFKNIDNSSFVYFVHSFYVCPDNDSYSIAKTDYGKEYVSAIRSKNIYGVQFHPEKSGKTGLKLLKNWLELC